MAPKAAAGQVVSGREYVDPIPVGRGDIASAPSDPACTTGKDTGYYSRLNLCASGVLYDIRLPIGVIANLKEGAVEAIWRAAVWSKSSGKVRVFLSPTGGKWSISNSIVVLQRFGGEPIPVEHSLALQAELAARAGKQRGGRGLQRAHDEPAQPRVTPAPIPNRKAPKPSGSAAAAVAVSLGGLAVAHARPWGTSMCPAPLSLSAVLWRAWGSPGSRDIGEFTRTSLTSLRDANASPGDAKGCPC